MLAFRCRLMARLVLVSCLLGLGASAHAQATQSATEHPDSRVDVYGGWGYFHPINSGIDFHQFFDVTNENATVSVTGFFNHYVGVQAEGGYFSGVSEHSVYGPCSGEACSQLIYTAEGGPVFRLPLGAWIPYLHALGGGVRTNGPVTQPLTWGWGVTGGGGVDYVLPFFKHHVAVRLIQADWQYSQVVYGPLVLPEGVKGGFGEIDALKLSGGLVWKAGEAKPKPALQIGCISQPAQGYPGDIITVTASAINFDTKRPAAYTWKTNGGHLKFDKATATIDTAGLAPGEYVVEAHVVQGMKARQQASCNTPFTIKPFEPPTLTCSATPPTATAGTIIDISTTGTSPQNRPLTYSYSASAGQITSEGPTAKLSTAGLSATTVTVTCNVVDDLGQTAQANTQVALTVPPTPVVPETQEMCHLSFERDRRRPDRVDNEAKGCLDDIALTLEQQAAAKLVMIGNSSANEQPEAGAERALNARQYLVQEKGIDSSRIELRAGSMPGRFVTNILVPPGAHFDPGTSQTFDENTIQRHGQAYGVHHAPSSAPHYQPRRVAPRHRVASPGAGNVSIPQSGPAPLARKPGAHPAKPSPGTPMPPKPASKNKSSSATPPLAKHPPAKSASAKPAPGTPVPTTKKS
ncbi:MAG TPA: hypothetical protein VIJ65_07740 [Acidobacteriaceae bacterium]